MKDPGGCFQKNWVGVFGTLPETLTLFRTKICDFPYPISDLIKNLIPYFRPETLEPGAWQERVTSCYSTYTVGVNNKREMDLSPNDEEVASSEKIHTQFKTTVHKPNPISNRNRNWYPISDQNNSQHCCANNVGSCCVGIGSGVQTDLTTPNKLGTCSASWEQYNP